MVLVSQVLVLVLASLVLVLVLVLVGLVLVLASLVLVLVLTLVSQVLVLVLASLVLVLVLVLAGLVLVLVLAYPVLVNITAYLYIQFDHRAQFGCCFSYSARACKRSFANQRHKKSCGLIGSSSIVSLSHRGVPKGGHGVLVLLPPMAA